MFDLERKPENQVSKTGIIARRASEGRQRKSPHGFFALSGDCFLHPNWIHHARHATRADESSPPGQQGRHGHSVGGRAHPRRDPSLPRP